jgi:hypothetical protein
MLREAYFIDYTVKPVHNGLCPQRKPVINGHFVKNTSFFIVFVWNSTFTQRKLSITSDLFPPEQIFVQTNLFTTNFLSTFFCSQVKKSDAQVVRVNTFHILQIKGPSNFKICMKRPLRFSNF